MKLPIIVWVFIFLGVVIIFCSFPYIHKPAFDSNDSLYAWLTLLVLTVTLIFLVWYTYDTHRIAEQTIEKGLRPIILIEGYIDWDNILFTLAPNTAIVSPLKFLVLNNIAQNVYGYMIINNKKYNLVFANEATTQRSIINNSMLTMYTEWWSWISAGSYLNAIYNPNHSSEEYEGENCIYLKYTDIEGNNYFTLVDKNSKQKTSRLS